MINIVVPMAGRGSRFAGASETSPKPLISVLPSKRMIEYVIDFLTLPEPHRFIFVCLDKHQCAFDFDDFFRERTPDYRLVVSKSITRGPAASALLAGDLIDNGDELLIAYCDSFLTVDPMAFFHHFRMSRADGGVITYPCSAPTDSYADVDAAGRVLRTAEKKVISATATAGFCYFKEGRDYVAGARAMIDADPRDSTEHFVCPVYNDLIRHNKTVASYLIDHNQRIEMGTPEDLARSRPWLMQHRPTVSHLAQGDCR